MANQEHLDILKQGVDVWNKWREENQEIEPDLRRADLRGANLFLADLKEVNLNEAHLEGADLRWADLRFADLWGAHLEGAKLNGANLFLADLNGAKLNGANLIGAQLIQTNLIGADLTGCYIYGISAWDVKIGEATQNNLRITLPDQPAITLDSLEVAQFIYLLLNNKKIRQVIDTITSKVVLILGRFTPERKIVLDTLRDELHKKYNLLPIMFDFDPTRSQDLTETVATLAHMSRFIIVDLTDPSCSPYEIKTIAPECVRPIKPIISKQPIIIDGKEVERREFAMLKDLQYRYDWVLTTYRYKDIPGLLASLEEKIIKPAEKKAMQLERRRQKR